MKYARAIVFLFILSATYCLVNSVFLKKGLVYERQKQFLEFEEYYDVVSIGSSFVFCTVNPIILYKECGLRAYNLGSPLQTVEMSYFYAKQAIEHMHPKLLVIGATFFVYSAGQKANTDEYIHCGSDAFPFGFNKVKMLSACKLSSDIETYLFPLMKYHSRWKSLRMGDFDRDKGWNANVFFNGLQIFANTTEERFPIRNVSLEDPSPVNDGNLSYLRAFKELADANDCRLLMIASPQKTSSVKSRLGRYVTLFQKAREMGIDVIDLGAESEQLGVAVETDFWDSGHVNVLGAEKCTRRIARFIKDHYGLIPPVLSDKERQKYETLCERYHRQKDSELKKELIRRDEAKRHP